jgi:hypothetical protein
VGVVYLTKQEPPSEIAGRQASAQEIYSGEVNNAMIAAGMRALERFESTPGGLGKTRAEMVARIYSAMEEIRRLCSQEVLGEPESAEQ